MSVTWNEAGPMLDELMRFGSVSFESKFAGWAAISLAIYFLAGLPIEAVCLLLDWRARRRFERWGR